MTLIAATCSPSLQQKVSCYDSEYVPLGKRFDMSNKQDKNNDSNEGRKMCSSIIEVSCAVLDEKDVKMRSVGRRKNGQQKNGKQKKGGEGGGESYGRNGSARQRHRSGGSQGNGGSSGMEGSGGEGSGNGDDSSDDDEEDCEEDGDEEEEEEDDDEEEEDEEEMDTDNVSTIVEDDIDDATTNGSFENQPLQKSLELKRLEFENPGPKVAPLPNAASANNDVKQENTEMENTMEGVLVPAPPGTPVTLSGIIWKETTGVLVVNLKYRNKTYSGSLIDNARHGWATPRNFDDQANLSSSPSKRGKGRKGRHNGSVYTGNPMSPKMTGKGKRGSRFHRNKSKHGKDSFVRPRSKRAQGSDNAEEGTRTRRRSCTVKTTSVSPSPSPTPLIECPERNCNKKYKHINGLRYHQAHAHLDNIADPDEKDSDEDEESKSNGMKDALSKSSSSDDVKPLSRRKTKAQQKTNKNEENSAATLPEEAGESEQKAPEVTKPPENDVKLPEIKIEPDEPVIKPDQKHESSSSPNILQEAVKMIFDEPSVPDSQITCANDVAHPGIFARMISQHMMAGSHGEAYKYLSYEPVPADSMNTQNEKTGTSVGVVEDIGVTVKEEVLEEGNVGVPKLPSKDPGEDNLVGAGTKLDYEKCQEEISGGQGVLETTKTKLVTEKQQQGSKALHSNRKNGASDVAKEAGQMKTSAAEIRSLPGYQHFRVSSNNANGSAFISQLPEDKTCKSSSLDTRLFDAKEPDKSVSGMIWDSGGTAKQQGSYDKQKYSIMKMPATSSYQLTCESLNRSGYRVSSSKKPPSRSVVTASTTWIPEVHPAVMQKPAPGASFSGQDVVPEKQSRDVVVERAAARTGEQQQEELKGKSEKGTEEERSKASAFTSKPARAVGVAHPFNSEKSEDEFALGSIGSFSSESVKVLYSKSSSPKVSLDRSNPEVKKVRVEKTLEVPVGEVIPLAKTNRSAVNTSETAVIVGGEGNENYSRAPLTDQRLSEPVDGETLQRETSGHPSYMSSERPVPWQPAYSPPVVEARLSRDTGQYPPRNTSPLRKPDRRSSPVRELGRSTSSRDKRLPFSNIDERSPTTQQRDKNLLPGRSSPEKDPSARATPRGAETMAAYRGGDSERLSPGAAQFRDYNRSPVGETSGRRSPVRNRLQRSPDREILGRASYRTSPSPSNRDGFLPYRERSRQPNTGDLEETAGVPRRTGESDVRRAGTPKTGASRAAKEVVDESNAQRSSAENKPYPRLSEQEAMMLNMRQRFFPYPAAATHQDSATREAMENYMMYFGRIPIPATLDPRLLQAYSMLPGAQIPLLIPPPPKEASATKDERAKEGSDETRSKTVSSKSDTSSRNRPPPAAQAFPESSDLEIVSNKRLLSMGIGSSGAKTEKTEYESSPSKRLKPSQPKDVHEILDDREGSKMPHKKLEDRVYHQAFQHKIDALNQLQSEENLKQKAEEKNASRIKSSSSSSGSSSRQKSTADYRSKKEESLFSGSRSYEKDKISSKDDKSRLSPAARINPPCTSDSVVQTWGRSSENRSPPPPGPPIFPGFVPASHLPANHALSNNYEQATLAMQGMSPFLMPPYPLPPGIMMANPLVPAGAQFHPSVVSRDMTKRSDHSRSSSSSTTTAGEQSRPKDDDEREYNSTKKDVKIPPSDSPTKYEVDRGGRDRIRKTNENDEEKPRTPSLHGSQNLPSNLAFGRGNMAGIEQPHFGHPFPRMIYPPSAQGKASSYRPPFEHQYSPYSRK